MKNKMNKKAWIRITEAFIAVLIILGAVIVILSRAAPVSNISEQVYEKQNSILKMIGNNDSLRGDILNGKNERVNNFILTVIPSSWNFTTVICKPEEICNGNIPFDRDVYSSETLISSNLTLYNIKKLRFSVWVK
jgi:hypothetical protein